MSLLITYGYKSSINIFRAVKIINSRNAVTFRVKRQINFRDDHFVMENILHAVFRNKKLTYEKKYFLYKCFSKIVTMKRVCQSRCFHYMHCIPWKVKCTIFSCCYVDEIVNEILSQNFLSKKYFSILHLLTSNKLNIRFFYSDKWAIVVKSWTCHFSSGNF